MQSRDHRPENVDRAYGAMMSDTSAISRRMKSPWAPARYCLASGAARTWRQAAGNCASVGPSRGFGGSFGGLGGVPESLNPKAKALAVEPFPSHGAPGTLAASAPG